MGDWEPAGDTDSGMAVDVWGPVGGCAEANLNFSTIALGAVMLSGNIISAGSLNQFLNCGLILKIPVLQNPKVIHCGSSFVDGRI